jgi:hypothetical protein
VFCTNNLGYEASLEKCKIYRQIGDPAAESLGQVRVVDESGEDYLYPKARFVAVRLPQLAVRAVAGTHRRASVLAPKRPAAARLAH